MYILTVFHFERLRVSEDIICHEYTLIKKQECLQFDTLSFVNEVHEGFSLLKFYFRTLN